MYLRKNALLKYALAISMGFMLFGEWFIYLVPPFFWKQLKCENDGSCTKILFIADPQIQGDEALPAPFSTVVNWDSDNYLKRTFNVAIEYFRPDVLVYLGDLMDEGSIATMKQYHQYVKRLSNIFELNDPVTQIWIPGDNDIGGEGEPIYKDKVTEFEKVFNQPSVVTHKNISFYKVNGITHTYPKAAEGDDSFKIVVSHYPITGKYGFGEKVNTNIRPEIYFCAHDHESKYVMRYRNLSRHGGPTTLQYGDPVIHVKFNTDTIYEIYVPTCSYRMGTWHIGYGAAIIENNNQQLRYTVFWSPGRFPTLFAYLSILTLLLLYSIIYFATRRLYKCCYSETLSTKSDATPLLKRV